jgi:oligopeptide transport system ATP-binding protein
MSIIFITHNLGVVADICDKVSVMYGGRIVEQGPVDDIFYRPGHPYTKGLLRSMPRVDADSYERLIPIDGSPVDMLNPPAGCPFAPRCDSCMRVCINYMPDYTWLGEKHFAACWLHQSPRNEAAGGSQCSQAPTSDERGNRHEQG